MIQDTQKVFYVDMTKEAVKENKCYIFTSRLALGRCPYCNTNLVKDHCLFCGKEFSKWIQK